jgi:hypothetical protein
MCWQEWSYISQVALAAIAFVAALLAYCQWQTFKRFELMKMIEDRRVRKARRLLYEKLRLKRQSRPWWKTDRELETAASTVCATYDIVGLTADWGNFRYFGKHWAHSIIWTYDALDTYLKDRRESDNSEAYKGYCKLYKYAKKHRLPSVSPLSLVFVRLNKAGKP